jgi:methylenetetrahydrofolate reductase (NADPH)
MERELSRLISKYWIFPNPFDKDPFDDALEQKKADFMKAGIEYTIRQIDQYRALGIEGIHLYALNKWQDVSTIIRESGMRTVI